jgi:hypothetical protein
MLLLMIPKSICGMLQLLQNVLDGGGMGVFIRETGLLF